ncbi:uncharacterized protein LOC127135507 [Lathyrus oleraceus]|uniref:uncharacterized protein LOC127135507 n=1 Tax=Pisum sativum TaxID=3888 RepID=UPI001FC3E19D|nr:uncharacterized protein LOC127135507 [Pisum sativum]
MAHRGFQRPIGWGFGSSNLGLHSSNLSKMKQGGIDNLPSRDDNRDGGNDNEIHKVPEVCTWPYIAFVLDNIDVCRWLHTNCITINMYILTYAAGLHCIIDSLFYIRSWLHGGWWLKQGCKTSNLDYKDHNGT